MRVFDSFPGTYVAQLCSIENFWLFTYEVQMAIAFYPSPAPAPGFIPGFVRGVSSDVQSSFIVLLRRDARCSVSDTSKAEFLSEVYSTLPNDTLIENSLYLLRIRDQIDGPISMCQVVNTW